MKFTTTIEFESIETNFRHEASDKKRNTVRIVTEAEENEMGALINIKYIRIVCIDGTQSFIRELTDITRFTYNDTIMYIFSW